MCEEEEYDSKIPLHSDEAFQRGIQFKIKVIEKFSIQLKNTSNFNLVYRFTRSTETIESW